MRPQAALLLSFLMLSAAFAISVVPVQGKPNGSTVADYFTGGETTVVSGDSSEYFVSPITGLRYTIAHGSNLNHHVYVAGGIVYDSVDSILSYESSLYPDGLYKIEPSLRDAGADDEPDGRLSVVIFLVPQFGHETSLRVQESLAGDLQSLWDRREELLDRIMSKNMLGPLPADRGSVDSVLDAQFRSADEEYSTAVALMRRQMYADTEKLNLPTQEPLVRRIVALGGFVDYLGPFVNLIAARISPEGLRELVKDPLVGSVYQDRILEAKLDISVPSIRASDWWDAGYNTATYKLAVPDTGIDKTHPALSGKITDEKVFHDLGKTSPSYADDSTDPDDLHGHGTHIAGIVGSQDSTYHGVAYGLKGIINAKFGWLTDTGDGAGTWPDAMKAIDWAIGTAGASVVSFSFGDTVNNGNGNGGMTLFLDSVVDDLGIPFSSAAGNSGPGSGSLREPADGYNTLSVGAIDDGGTTNRNNDAIAWFSSRGPTLDGRIKPDIAAPGMDSSNPGWGINSCNNKWETQSDWVDYPGTSMASPHVGASLILLLNYFGPRGFFPAVPKALLLQNAEDKGAAGPDNNYGWGYMELNSTLQNRDKVYNTTVTPSEARFYLGTWAANDRATLVWQRHVTYRGTSYPTQYYSLNNLDLFLYNGQTYAQVASSTSTINNVEQTRYANALTSAVLKVKVIGTLNGVTAEPFALATWKTFTAVLPPTLQTTWTGPTSVEVGNVFTLTANVYNAGDLAALGVTATITVPPGLTLVSGANPALLGDIAPKATGAYTWSFRGDTVGDKTVNLSLAATAFGENFQGSSSYKLRVIDSFPPVINGIWALPSPQNAGLLVNISADITDNLGVVAAKANVTGPKGWVGNFSMAAILPGNIWYFDGPYYVAGVYDAAVWATDIDLWTSAITQFTIVDSTPPTVLSYDAQPNPQQIHGNVNITATAQDQAGVAGSWAEVTDPLGGKTNRSMSSSGDSYWLDQRYDVVGKYDYVISVTDPTGNWKVVAGSFDIVDTIAPAISMLTALPNPQEVFNVVNISATITDIGGVVRAWADVVNPLGGRTNTTMSSSGSLYWLDRPYGLLGDYSYTVSAIDIVGNWGVAGGSFKMIDTGSPIAEAGPDQTVEWQAVVQFDGSLSTDNVGVVNYTWSFDDGGPITLYGAAPSWRFLRLGTFVVTLAVLDYSGNQASDTMNVTVRDTTKPVILPPLAAPNPQNPDNPVEVRVKVTDNFGVTEVWLAIWDPYTIKTNWSMQDVGGNEYAFMQNYTLIGTYLFEIWATDSSHNWNYTSGFFVIKDMVAPTIMSVDARPNPQEVLYGVEIVADVQDSVAMAGAWVEIIRPGGSLAGNFSMAYDSLLGMYRRNYPTDALGMHTYRVVAMDFAGNWNSSSSQFLVRDTKSPSITPTNSHLITEVDIPFNFTALASDNFRIDQVFAEVKDPLGQNIGNSTMTFMTGIGSNYYIIFNFSILGDYQIRLSARDFGGNWGTSSAVVTTVDTQSPEANAGPDQTVTVNDLVQFDGSGSTDSHGIASYVWTFTENSHVVTLHGPRPVHTFVSPGSYMVTLRVADYADNSDTDRMIVSVQPQGTGNGGENNGERGLWQIFVDDVLIGQFWLVICLAALAVVLIVAVAARRRSRRTKAEQGKAARAKAQVTARTDKVPPPPKEDLVEILTPIPKPPPPPPPPPPPEDL